MLLVDTNIWLRMEDVDSEQNKVCTEAILKLKEEGVPLAVCAQVVIEFWTVMSRPIESNGLGVDAQTISTAVKSMLKLSSLLSEPADAAERWLKLAETYRPAGKRCHDLRLVVMAEAHGVDRILTLNTTDFRAFSELKAIGPSEI